MSIDDHAPHKLAAAANAVLPAACALVKLDGCTRSHLYLTMFSGCVYMHGDPPHGESRVLP
jgi:hypothetical protein